jgi:hypothetical protein
MITMALLLGTRWVIMLYNVHSAHLISNRHTKKDNTCGIEGGTTMSSFRNNLNMKTPIAVARKAQQFP